ncbi:MAG: hypothetical protein CFH42_00572 [Alphaproteobacteria bacterium MarineAlpha12_Bin1]|nr:MAG: hypothetical protein CFH42_00572 [Alphaproteobacteria bacterium MarineAlpha12_Bin1]|tara:strand:- start:2396 stop:3097 length:702 start_codon:yes stop_codon:yes gene_type:complete
MNDTPQLTSLEGGAPDGRQPLSQKLSEMGPRTQTGGFAKSRVVSAMKYVFPGLAMALLVVVVAWSEFDNDKNRFQAPEAVGPIGTTRPQVINARVLSVDNRLRPYQITADSSSLKKIEGREFYFLERPKADLVLEDGSWVALTAKDGEYEENSKNLFLVGNVSVYHEKGHELKTPKATINLDERSALGDEGVTGKGPLGSLSSEGFRIYEGGSRIIFTGKSKMIVQRGSRDTK